MIEQNYSMTDILNLASEVKELATFQNSIVWDSEAFTPSFQQEFFQVLYDKASSLEEFIQEIEFKADFKSKLEIDSSKPQS